jgi:hypothetical protein
MNTADSNSYVVEVEGLTKRFGARVAVDGVELRIPWGSAFGYLGPNGPIRISPHANGIVERQTTDSDYDVRGPPCQLDRAGLGLARVRGWEAGESLTSRDCQRSRGRSAGISVFTASV